MKVSVIMAVYNNDCVKILNAAINSILLQSFNDFEFIICDDASTDKTYELLYNIAKTDKRVRLLRNRKNLKAGGARNQCLSVAQGEFIAIMDSDDISHPQRLEKEVAFLKEHKEFDFVGAKGQYFSDDVDNGTGHYWFCPVPQKKDFLFTLPFVHGSMMFRAKMLVEAKGYSENKKDIRAEDYELIMRLYANGHKGANIGEILYYIRLDENAYKRRSYRYRLNECSVKYRGFRDLGLMPKAIPYVIKPLIVGLIPIKVLMKLKRNYYIDQLGEKNNGETENNVFRVF